MVFSVWNVCLSYLENCKSRVSLSSNSKIPPPPTLPTYKNATNTKIMKFQYVFCVVHSKPTNISDELVTFNFRQPA
jgi:hypothetical protein